MKSQHTKIINNDWVLSVLILLGFTLPTITSVIKHGYDPFAFIFIHFLIATVSLFANNSKITSLDEYVTFMTRWVLYPLIFLIWIVLGFIDRKKLRWLKKNWFYVCLNQLWKYMHSPINILGK